MVEKEVKNRSVIIMQWFYQNLLESLLEHRLLPQFLCSSSGVGLKNFISQVLLVPLARDTLRTTAEVDAMHHCPDSPLQE
jgi:hypothetical protein